MALVADASVGDKALSAKEWLSHSSGAQQRHLSPASRNKPASSGKECVASRERANESMLFSGMNLAHASSVEVILQALDVPMGNENEKEDAVCPLSSAFSPLIKSESSRRSPRDLSVQGPAPVVSSEVDLQAFDLVMDNSNKKRENEITPLPFTCCSPLIESKSAKSSSNQPPGDGCIPPLTSSCSPLIKSKSSKSSSNQGSLPGLVVAPDGVSLVKDRRKCKPRGVLTVGLEASSASSDGEVSLPMPSPSGATVEWVHENWNDTSQSHPDEPNRSSSTITSTRVSSPRAVLNFDLHEDCRMKLGARDPLWRKIREAAKLGPEIFPSIQEPHGGKTSVESRSAGLILGDNDGSFRLEPASELLPFGADYFVSTSSSKLQHHERPTEVVSPHMTTTTHHLDHHHPHDFQWLQLELQDDVNGSPAIEISKSPCDVIPRKHSEHRYPTVEEGETQVGTFENRSNESGSLGRVSASRSLHESPGSEGASSAEFLPGSLTDFAHAGGMHIVRQKRGDGSGSCGAEFSQRLHHTEYQLSPEELVAETLYELAAENLRKTRTGARKFRSLGEKLPTEAPSVLSVVKQSVSSATGEHATGSDVVPCLRSSWLARQVSPRSELAKVADFAQPLRTIVLRHGGDFSQQLTTVKALIGNVHAEAHDSEVQGFPTAIRGVYLEVEGPDHSTLALSKKPQRQRRQFNSGDCRSRNSKRRKAQQQRRILSCGKRAGLGSLLVAFGVLVMSLVIGSCQQCYKSNHYQYYIRPT